ncbi:palmitoyl-(protein) hydrolase [Aureococcus anophagefferens]|nr:palmitoyl-(protein) hydrolase [Aureococcus anophagefferens]
MSTSWLSMKKDDLRVNPKATKFLSSLGDQPLHLVSVFGAARQGKSFLMNALSGMDGVFKVSNALEPCTQGIDVSTSTLSLEKFRAVGGGGAPAAGGGLLSWLPGWGPAAPPEAASGGDDLVGFCDAEGQGDRDVRYDARLVCPALLASRCVIFNWKDSLQKDRILNQLGVMVRAAEGVADSGSGPVFGHLHVVFRDWTFEDDDAAKVKASIFGLEAGGKRGAASPDAVQRDEIRRALEKAFASVDVHLFPPPVDNISQLVKKGGVRRDELAPAFVDRLDGLRSAIVRQLACRSDTALLRADAPASARRLGAVVPELAAALNADDCVLPRSAYAAIVDAEVSALAESLEADGLAALGAAASAAMRAYVRADERARLFARDAAAARREADLRLGAPGKCDASRANADADRRLEARAAELRRLAAAAADAEAAAKAAKPKAPAKRKSVSSSAKKSSKKPKMTRDEAQAARGPAGAGSASRTRPRRSAERRAQPTGRRRDGRAGARTSIVSSRTDSI